uniref:RNA-directed RNA polymerase n=1 Tax=Elaeophora elaphi TaxID=1147741 RepID=A0A0R3RPA9_9BILA
MFPCLSIEQIQLLLNEANGNMDDVVEMAFELLNDIPSTSTSSLLEQPITGGDALATKRDQFTRTSLSLSSSEPIQNDVISVSCSIGKRSTIVERRIITVRLKLMISVEGVPKEQIKYILKNILQQLKFFLRVKILTTEKSLREIISKCDCSIRSFDELIPCLQAAYEEKCVEVHVVIELSCDGRSNQETLIDFTKSFIAESGYGLEMQPYMEIRNIDRLLTDIRPDHSNVDILWLGIGNMPNMGLFLIRGEYVTKYNACSNKLIVNSICETKMNNAAGNHTLLSWAHFEHDRRLLTIYFAMENVTPAHDGLSYMGYKFVITYSSFYTVIVDCDSDPDERDNYVYICLRHPPQLWEAIPRIMINGKRVLNIEHCRDWIRVGSFPGSKHFAGCSQEALADSSWLSFSMPKEAVKPERMFPDEVVEWQRRSLGVKLAPTRQLFEIIARWKRRAKCRIFFAAIMKIPRRQTSDIHILELPSFRLNYALQALLSRGSVVKDQLFDVSQSTCNNLFFERINYAAQECLLACEETLDSALAAVDEKRRISLLNFFEYNYIQKLNALRRVSTDEEAESLSDLPHNCVLIRKVVATPLRLLLLPPEVMMANRVVRHFGEEYALRCVFRDDNGQRLVPQEFSRGRTLQDQSLIIPDLVYRTLGTGIHIASRHYRFLAWSNSQMRDGGCYMYSDAVVNDEVHGQMVYNVEDIRRWMGDFTASKNVPKLMSRMGQCFTQAQPTIMLKKNEWKLEDDIMGGIVHPETGEVFNFSDGVGRISKKYADRIAKILDLHPTPSCYQVRFKGFKGVLCIDPLLDDLGQVNIIFRKSQKKFEEDEESAAEVEVVKYSMPSPVCLNRPLIMILDQVSEKQSRHLHKKVCNRIHSLLELELDKLAAMMFDEHDAAEELSSRLSLPIDFRQLHSSGITFTDEPFFRSLLIAVHRYNIKLHLSKSKVFLPASMGRTMYGVIDDSGLLQYGQVFIQYSSSIRYVSGKKIVHTGPVMVTKNPCHVAGDVRIFEAVYQDALSHLCDVIVFPRYGARPHPDEMAGSDLDGDEYAVIFDEELFFENNEQAMFFPKSIPIEYDTPPTTGDMIDFFLKYLSQDSIGRMSNAHLIIEVCDDIARKCAVAVDFPKTGVQAKPLISQEQCEVIPDYMQNMTRPSYRSKRLLGELYRKARKVEDISEIQEAKFADYCDPQLYDESLFYERPKLVERSLYLRNEYYSKMQQLLDEYGISDEASVISGHSVAIKRITEMEKDDYSFYHSDKIVELRYSRIFAHFRREFFKEFGEESDFLTVDAFGKRGMRWNTALITKAKVWYAVTYANAFRSCSQFRSFPWIVWDILLIVKRQIALMLKSPPPLVNPLAVHLTKAIETFCCHHHAALKQFVNDISLGPLRLEALVQYSQRYGSNVVLLCFVIDNWLRVEGVYERSALRRIHAIILFLQFTVGILHGKQTSDELMNRHPIYFEKLHNLRDNPETVDLAYSTGEILFAFLRYLASRQFACANFIRFRLGGMMKGKKGASIFTKPGQWFALHAVAFRTFHHIAITAEFDALRITGNSGANIDCNSNDDFARYEWDFGESDAPVIVSGELCSHKDISLQRINTALKKWSGVDEIMSRTTKHEQLLITCTGSAVNRQRLHRILLMEPERLFDAVQTDIKPKEARDDYL